MLKRNVAIFFPVLLSVLLLGCSKDDDGDVILNRTYWPSSEMYVRFVFTDGTNVLDAIGVEPQIFTSSYYNYPTDDPAELKIEIMNVRSGIRTTPNYKHDSCGHLNQVADSWFVICCFFLTVNNGVLFIFII